MIGRRHQTLFTTQRLKLGLPVMADHREWVDVRKRNHDYLIKWEPKKRPDQHNAAIFKERIRWAREGFKHKRAIPLFIRRSEDNALMGAITMDNIRLGPARAASLGYWIGEEFTNQGYMQEAVSRVVAYAFSDMDLSRVEAATLKENIASQRVLENSGFRYEGVAQAYLQINGRWRAHRLYANLRRDRLGVTEAGVD